MTLTAQVLLLGLAAIVPTVFAAAIQPNALRAPNDGFDGSAKPNVAAVKRGPAAKFFYEENYKGGFREFGGTGCWIIEPLYIDRIHSVIIFPRYECVFWSGKRCKPPTTVFTVLRNNHPKEGQGVPRFVSDLRFDTVQCKFIGSTTATLDDVTLSKVKRRETAIKLFKQDNFKGGYWKADGMDCNVFNDGLRDSIHSLVIMPGYECVFWKENSCRQTKPLFTTNNGHSNEELGIPRVLPHMKFGGVQCTLVKFAAAAAGPPPMTTNATAGTEFTPTSNSVVSQSKHHPKRAADIIGKFCKQPDFNTDCVDVPPTNNCIIIPHDWSESTRSIQVNHGWVCLFYYTSQQCRPQDEVAFYMDARPAGVEWKRFSLKPGDGFSGKIASMFCSTRVMSVAALEGIVDREVAVRRNSAKTSNMVVAKLCKEPDFNTNCLNIEPRGDSCINIPHNWRKNLRRIQVNHGWSCLFYSSDICDPDTVAFYMDARPVGLRLGGSA